MPRPRINESRPSQKCRSKIIKHCQWPIIKHINCIYHWMSTKRHHASHGEFLATLHTNSRTRPRQAMHTDWLDNETQDAVEQTECGCRQTMAAATAVAADKRVKNNWSSNDLSTGPDVGCLDVASGKSSRRTFNDYQAITFRTLPIPTVFPTHTS